jgi:hypothetical protein
MAPKVAASMQTGERLLENAAVRLGWRHRAWTDF